MKGFIAAVLALLAFAAASTSASAGGNSDAKRCLEWDANQPGTTGPYAKLLQTETGGTFSSYEDCLAYAKHGKLFAPTATNSLANVGSLGSATLSGSGFHRNEQMLAVLVFVGYTLDFYRPTTDARGNFSMEWTWRDCASIPEWFGTPPYDAYFAVSEGDFNDDSVGVHALTPTFTVC